MNNIPKTIIFVREGYVSSLYASEFEVEGENVKFLLTNTRGGPTEVHRLFLHIRTADGVNPKLLLREDLKIPAQTTIEVSTGKLLSDARKRFSETPCKIESFKIDTRI